MNTIWKHMRPFTMHGLVWSGRSLEGATPPTLPADSEVFLYRPGYLLAKRCFDISVCLFLLLPTLAVIGICGLLIWLEDRGPIFFPQARTGLGGRRFMMLKLRTMVVDAEQRKAECLAMNKLQWPDFKIEHDPRVTRIGGWLRRTSLDELPQLFNVLKGDMSLVGPRPTSFDVSTYSLHHTERLEVLPGVTGIWQVRGRADCEFDERLEMDLEYIRHRSFRLDLLILLQTLTAPFRAKGAY